MADDDPCYLPALAAAEAFRARRLSPVELLDALIARWEAIADTVNPFADRYFEEARQRARKAEAKFTATDGRPRRLEGIPLAVKETAAIRGQRSTWGSLLHRDDVATATDPAVERLVRAGANVFCRTTSPEFAWLYATHSRLWGVTRNPWRLDTSVGGSSGGSAAALAAGATTVATGGDSTGSIRQPASQCGVVGYQAPFGRIPLLASSNSYVHHGPMTRTVADAALLAGIMAGPHLLDPNSLPGRVRIPERPEGVEGLRIAYSLDLGYHPLAADVRRETLAALETLRAAGADLVEVPVDWAAEAIRLAHRHQEFLFADRINRVLAEHGDLVSDYVPQLAETANAATAEDYRRTHAVADRVWREHLGPLFRDHHAFVTPTVSCPDSPADAWQQDTIEVNGRQATDTDTAMTVLWNMFGRCPVLAAPSGRADSGVPTGIQIVGRPHDDAMVFRIGRALEERRPWLDVPERRPQIRG